MSKRNSAGVPRGAWAISSNFRRRARALGSSDEAMGSLVAPTFVRRRAIAPEAARFSLRFSGAGIPSFRLAGIRPTNLFRLRSCWDSRGEGLLFSWDTSLSGQFAQQRKLGLMAQEAALAVSLEYRAPQPVSARQFVFSRGCAS